MADDVPGLAISVEERAQSSLRSWLSAQKDPRNGPRLLENLVEAAVAYLLTTDPTDTPHWFCDAQCYEWSEYAILLVIFDDNEASLKVPYLDALSSVLERCAKCAVLYQRAQFNARSLFENMNAQKEVLARVMRKFFFFDTKRLEKQIEERYATLLAEPDRRFFELELAIPLAETLNNPMLFANPVIESFIFDKGSAFVKENYDIIGSLGGFEVSPGDMALLFSPRFYPISEKRVRRFRELYMKKWNPLYLNAVAYGIKRFSNAPDSLDFSAYVVVEVLDFVKCLTRDQQVKLLDTIDFCYRDKQGTFGIGFLALMTRLTELPSKIVPISFLQSFLGKVLPRIDLTGSPPLGPWPEEPWSQKYTKLDPNEMVLSFVAAILARLESHTNDKETHYIAVCATQWLLSKSEKHVTEGMQVGSKALELAPQVLFKSSTGVLPQEILYREDMFRLLYGFSRDVLNSRCSEVTNKYHIRLVSGLFQYGLFSVLSKETSKAQNSTLEQVLSLMENITSSKPGAPGLENPMLVPFLENMRYAILSKDLQSPAYGDSLLAQLIEKGANLLPMEEEALKDVIIQSRGLLSSVFALSLLPNGLSDRFTSISNRVMALASERTESSQELLVVVCDSLSEVTELILARDNYPLYMPYLRLLSKVAPLVLNDDFLVNGLDSSAEVMQRQLCVLRLASAAWTFLSYSAKHLHKWSMAPEYREYEHLKVAAYVPCLLETIAHILKLATELVTPAYSPSHPTSFQARLASVAAPFGEEMLPFLRLRSEPLRILSVQNAIVLFDLLCKCKVEISKTALDALESVASRETKTEVSIEELEKLLLSTQAFEKHRIDSMVDKFKQMRSAANAAPKSAFGQSRELPGASQPAIMKSDTEKRSDHFRKHSGKSLPSVQPSLKEYFKMIPKDQGAPEVQWPRLTSQGVTPSAPVQLSMMERVKQDLMARPGGPANIAARRAVDNDSHEIHPARPAGFNSRKREAQPEKDAGVKVLGQSVSKQPESSASESEESDSDDGGGALIALGRTKLRNIDNVKRVAPGLQGKLARAPTPTDKELEAKRMRQRLSVDPSDLHRAILKWDYFGLAQVLKTYESNLVEIPNKFKSSEQYLEIMEPLLHMEVLQSLQRAREENESRPFLITVGKRVSTDDFVDIYVSVASDVLAHAKLTDADLLVLSFDGTGDPTRAEPPNRKRDYALAKIKENTLSPSRKSYVDFQIRTYRADKLLKHIRPGTILHALRICSITTAEREYRALKALPFYELKNEILEAEPAVVLPDNSSAIAKYQSAMELNASQAKAVYQAVNARGFSLIQGPPGTGKTKTILGIIGAYFSEVRGRKRVLVCAPSNAAVDELVLRLKSGVPDSSGRLQNLKIVRLGRGDAMNEQVRDVNLEELVTKSVSTSAAPVDEELKAKYQKLVSEKKNMQTMLEDRESNDLDSGTVGKLTTRIEVLDRTLYEYRKLLTVQSEQISAARRVRDVQYKQLQEEILKNSEVVCATLSGSAYSLLASLEQTFDTVIVDEAAQCVELSVLIPLRYGCRRCIMVGDPNQLPPTVLSKEASKAKYEQSLFVRMYNQHPGKVRLLDTQFRMHPDIASFPSLEFYQNKLLNGPDMARKTSRQWHENKLFGPMRFFSVRGRQEKSNSLMSLRNREEVATAILLIKELFKQYPDIDFKGKIAVVSPYKLQVREMREMFTRQFGANILKSVDFSSIDGFQGQEKDIVILSCVRAERDTNRIGFLADIRRMNVALTRPRSSLWVLGHPSSLSINKVWTRLMDLCRSNEGWFVPNLTSETLKSGSVNLHYSRGDTQRSKHPILNQNLNDSRAKGRSRPTPYEVAPDSNSMMHPDRGRSSNCKGINGTISISQQATKGAPTEEDLVGSTHESAPLEDRAALQAKRSGTDLVDTPNGESKRFKQNDDKTGGKPLTSKDQAVPISAEKERPVIPLKSRKATPSLFIKRKRNGPSGRARS